MSPLDDSYTLLDIPSFDDIANRFTIFAFERDFFNLTYIASINTWMLMHWYNSIYYSIIYVLLVFAGQIAMKNRSAFNLKPLLIVWNICLAIFSAVGFFRTLPEFVHAVTVEGLEYSICNNSNAFGVTGYWTYAFFLSKQLELLDTVFIVLRKRPLIFLHWFHHATVLVLTWYLYRSLASVGRWFVVINFGIHMFMYSYYACRALEIRLPRCFAMSITFMQIVQMCFGCFVNYNVLLAKRAKRHCRVSYSVVYFSFAIYFVYLLLFANFFVRVYIFGRKKDKTAFTGCHASAQMDYPSVKQTAVSSNMGEGKETDALNPILNCSKTDANPRKRKATQISNNHHRLLTNGLTSFPIRNHVK